MAGAVVNMHRLPAFQTFICFNFRQNAVCGLHRFFTQQPVAAGNRLFADIPAQVNRHAVTGLSLFLLTVLGMNTAHTDRFITAGHP